MSDVFTAKRPDELHDANTPDSPGQKRKREDENPYDQRSKRSAPPADMSISAETQSYIDSAIGASHAASANGVNVADFNALQQATQDGHGEATDPTSATSTAQAALGMYPTLHVPSTTEEQFSAHPQDDGGDHGDHDPNSNAHFAQGMPHPDGLMDASQNMNNSPGTDANGMPTDHRYSTSGPGGTPKPTVGSEEWHKMRKDNHKEVERRRRETINEGINELAKIVPGCEKNKGSILQRAVQFITQLKENEQQNIEKWTLEKLLTEQAITELSASNDKLKQECERLYRELETWKRVAQNAGLEPPQPKEDPATTSSGPAHSSNATASA